MVDNSCVFCKDPVDLNRVNAYVQEPRKGIVCHKCLRIAIRHGWKGLEAVLTKQRLERRGWLGRLVYSFYTGEGLKS